MQVVLKRQELMDDVNDTTNQGASKQLYVYEYNNKERQDLDRYKGKGGKYVLISSCLHKESNRLTDLSKERKSLINFIYIPKLSYLIIAKFLLEISSKRGLKV